MALYYGGTTMKGFQAAVNLNIKPEENCKVMSVYTYHGKTTSAKKKIVC